MEHETSSDIHCSPARMSDINSQRLNNTHVGMPIICEINVLNKTENMTPHSKQMQH